MSIQGARRPSVYYQTAGERRACDGARASRSAPRRPHSFERYRLRHFANAGPLRGAPRKPDGTGAGLALSVCHDFMTCNILCSRIMVNGPGRDRKAQSRAIRAVRRTACIFDNIISWYAARGARARPRARARAQHDAGTLPRTSTVDAHKEWESSEARGRRPNGSPVPTALQRLYNGSPVPTARPLRTRGPPSSPTRREPESNSSSVALACCRGS